MIFLFKIYLCTVNNIFAKNVMENIKTLNHTVFCNHQKVCTFSANQNSIRKISAKNLQPTAQPNPQIICKFPAKIIILKYSPCPKQIVIRLARGPNLIILQVLCASPFGNDRTWPGQPHACTVGKTPSLTTRLLRTPVFSEAVEEFSEALENSDFFAGHSCAGEGILLCRDATGFRQLFL